MGTMAVAGVLIWSKLRLATNLPRSAYAVPEAVADESAETNAQGPARWGNGTSVGSEIPGPDTDTFSDAP